jgi:CxxC motif-containing protein
MYVMTDEKLDNLDFNLQFVELEYLIKCTKALREIAKDSFENARDIVIEAQIVTGVKSVSTKPRTA